MIWKTIMMSMLISVTLSAWDGYSYETGTYIDVESYDHQGKGEGHAEYFDYNDGQYHSGYLDMYVGGTGTMTDENGRTFEVNMN